MPSRIPASIFCLILSTVFSWAQEPEPASPDATPPPTTSVQIVNATSVPSISLSLNGRNDYPSFPQGLFTGDAPTETLSVKYQATNLENNASAESELINYENGANQTLVIMGDFSTDVPPGEFPQPGKVYEQGEEPYPPNVLFRVYPHTLKASESPIRLRIINAMPGKNLQFGNAAQKKQITPGSELVLSSQPASYEYEAMVDDQKIPVLMNQEGGSRNAMIVFYLKDEKPAFMRVFENTAKTRDTAQD